MKKLISKKIVNHIQIILCTLIGVTILTIIVSLLFGDDKTETLVNVWRVVVVVFTTGIALVAIEEIKFLKKEENLGDILVVIVSMVGTITAYLLNDVMFVSFKVADLAVYCVLCIPFIASLFHPRYGIIASLLIAGIYASISLFEYNEMSVRYFYVLAILLGITLISFIFKLTFFTKWSKFIKEKPSVENR